MNTSTTQTYDIAKESYKKHVALGEKATTDVFWLSLEGNEDLKWLVQSSQIPQIGREIIEMFGPNGVQFKKWGRYKNIGELPITFLETIEGIVAKAVIEWVLSGDARDATLEAFGLKWKLRDCILEIDGTEMNYEDNTLVKPAGTLHVGFIELPSA
jgi:hypothetical protein